MCFVNNMHDYHIATEPITCYKLMTKVGDRVNSLMFPRSVYGAGIPYKVGDTITASRTPQRWLDCIEVRRHEVNANGLLYGEVVHSYADEANIMCEGAMDGTVFVRCEIPVGETYWHNCGQYASFSVVIKEVYDYKWLFYYETYSGAKNTWTFAPTLSLDDIRENVNSSCMKKMPRNTYKWYAIEKVAFSDKSYNKYYGYYGYKDDNDNTVGEED